MHLVKEDVVRIDNRKKKEEEEEERKLCLYHNAQLKKKKEIVKKIHSWDQRILALKPQLAL